jgi:hypothetical protein
MSAPPDRIDVRTDPGPDGKVFLSVYEGGEIVAQPDMDWPEALELASQILGTALALKRRQIPREHSAAPPATWP